MKQKTLIIVKPDGFRKKLVGECIKRFENAGLEIKELKVTRLKKQFMLRFYAHLKKKLNPVLFREVLNYLTSGTVVIAIMEGDNAVAKAIAITGPTNPKAAKKGTIRGDFGTDDMAKRMKQKKPVRNIVHRSGSFAEAKEEIRLIKKLF